jgi:dihydroxyacetone kinase DhaKLM complex PTS-EIIA-like component DhaM
MLKVLKEEAVELIDEARESVIANNIGEALMNLEKAMDLLKCRNHLWTI